MSVSDGESDRRRSEREVADFSIPLAGERDWGISLSGGGIRAAAFGLGALQALEDHHLLESARFLSAVSGGSYIASATTLVADGPTPKQPSRSLLDRLARFLLRIPRGPKPDVVKPAETTPNMPPFSHGSPEERRLRNHLLYLTKGPGGVVAVIGRAMLGFLLNIAVVAGVIYVVMRAAGWVYGASLTHLQDHQRCPPKHTAGCVTHFQAASVSWILVATLGAAGLVAGIFWVARDYKTPERRQLVGATCGLLMGSSVLLFVLLIALPYVLVFLRGSVASYPGGPNGLPSTQAAATSRAAVPLGTGTAVGLAGVLASIAGTVTSLLKAPSGIEQRALGVIRRFLARHRTFVINALAAVAGPLLAVAWGLLVLNWGAAHPPWIGRFQSNWQEAFLLEGLPLVLLGILVYFGSLNSWSLHPYYKQHLSSAFAVGRIKGRASRDSTTAVEVTDKDWFDAIELPYEAPYPFSAVQPDKNFPTLVVCAAANISDYGATPTGSNVSSFVFNSHHVGGPVVGYCRTKDYEVTGQGQRYATMPSAMAASGAAISPSMGRMSRPPLRFLMALANLRLGVWLPNPRLVETNQWTTKWRPRVTYLLRELLGRNQATGRFIYVTDGGHYENLGLVELLRRKCRWIWCVDASGEQIDSFSTIGQAIGLARAELNIDISNLDLAGIGPLPPERASSLGPVGDRLVVGTHARATIRYPDKTTGTLVIIKAGVTEDAPTDVRTFQEGSAHFPYDSTFDQLFTGERFDAYRTLGHFAVDKAIRAVRTDFDLFRSPSLDGDADGRHPTELIQE